MKLLLLEDDLDARQALAALLALDGFDVLQAGNEAEFMQATEQLDIGAILFDVWLGAGVDAIGLVMDYQSRRTRAGHPQARLVCLTGSVEVTTEPATPFPIAAALSKPAEYSVILSALRTRTAA